MMEQLAVWEGSGVRCLSFTYFFSVSFSVCMGRIMNDLPVGTIREIRMLIKAHREREL